MKKSSAKRHKQHGYHPSASLQSHPKALSHCSSRAGLPGLGEQHWGQRWRAPAPLRSLSLAQRTWCRLPSCPAKATEQQAGPRPASRREFAILGKNSPLLCKSMPFLLLLLRTREQRPPLPPGLVLHSSLRELCTYFFAHNNEAQLHRLGADTSEQLVLRSCSPTAEIPKA